MGTLVSSIFESFSTVITGLASGLMIHFLVYLPYRGILALMRYKPWRKKGSGKR